MKTPFGSSCDGQDQSSGSGTYTVPTPPSTNINANQVNGLQEFMDSAITTAHVGASFGVASLDAQGRIPAGQMASFGNFPGATTFPVDSAVSAMDVGKLLTLNEQGQVVVYQDSPAIPGVAGQYAMQMNSYGYSENGAAARMSYAAGNLEQGNRIKLSLGGESMQFFIVDNDNDNNIAYREDADEMASAVVQKINYNTCGINTFEAYLGDEEGEIRVYVNGSYADPSYGNTARFTVKSATNEIISEQTFYGGGTNYTAADGTQDKLPYLIVETDKKVLAIPRHTWLAGINPTSKEQELELMYNCLNQNSEFTNLFDVEIEDGELKLVEKGLTNANIYIWGDSTFGGIQTIVEPVLERAKRPTKLPIGKLSALADGKAYVSCCNVEVYPVAAPVVLDQGMFDLRNKINLVFENIKTIDEFLDTIQKYFNVLMVPTDDGKVRQFDVRTDLPERVYGNFEELIVENVWELSIVGIAITNSDEEGNIRVMNMQQTGFFLSFLVKMISRFKTGEKDLYLYRSCNTYDIIERAEFFEGESSEGPGSGSGSGGSEGYAPPDLEDDSVNQVVKWEYTGAASYYVEMALDEEFSSIVSSQTTGSTWFDYSMFVPGYYYVRVRNDAPDTAWSKVYIYVQGAGSGSGLYSPPSLSDDSATYTVYWDYTGAASYYVEVAEDEAFTLPVASYSTSDNWYDYSMLDSGYFYVRVRNEEPDMSWSTISIYAPGSGSGSGSYSPPSISDNAESQMINWDSTGDAMYYVEVSEDDMFTMTIYSGSTPNNWIDYDTLDAGNYYVRVRNSAPDTSWSNTVYITAVGSGSGTGSGSGSGSGSFDPPMISDDSEGQTINWDSTGDALYYIEIADDETFTMVVLSDSTADNWYDYDTLDAGSYYARVRNSSEDTSWSSVITITAAGSGSGTGSGSGSGSGSFDPPVISDDSEGQTINWDSTGDALYYIEIADDEAFTMVVLSDSTADNWYDYDTLDAGSYYARVRNSSEDTSWSSAITITAAGSGSGTGSGSGSGSGAAVLSIDTELWIASWSPSSDTDELEISLDSTFMEASIVSLVTNSPYDFSADLSVTNTYYARVYHDGEYSDTVEFYFEAT